MESFSTRCLSIKQEKSFFLFFFGLMEKNNNFGENFFNDKILQQKSVFEES